MKKPMPHVCGSFGPLFFLVAMLGLSTGCGEEKGQPPVLTGFEAERLEFVPGFNLEMFDLKGTVTFSDPDGDLMIFRTLKRDCGLGGDDYLEWFKQELLGVTKGSASFLVPVSALCPAGEYSVLLYGLDNQGNESNRIEIRYRICKDFRCD
jgi:hypothetical protein